MDFFGQKLVNARSVRGYTQRELADRADISVVQLHRYETGKVTPRVLAVQKLAAALRVPAEWLTSNKDVDNVPNVDGQAAIAFQLPTNLIDSIKELAQEGGRSVNEQAIFMLEYALNLTNQHKTDYGAPIEGSNHNLKTSTLGPYGYETQSGSSLPSQGSTVLLDDALKNLLQRHGINETDAIKAINQFNEDVKNLDMPSSEDLIRNADIHLTINKVAEKAAQRALEKQREEMFELLKESADGSVRDDSYLSRYPWYPFIKAISEAEIKARSKKSKPPTKKPKK